MPQLKNPCCVPLDDEQVMVDLNKHGRPLAKYLLRIEGRPLTRDEALALAAAPGTRAERAAAVERSLAPCSKLGPPAGAFAVAARRDGAGSRNSRARQQRGHRRPELEPPPSVPPVTGARALALNPSPTGRRRGRVGSHSRQR